MYRNGIIIIVWLDEVIVFAKIVLTLINMDCSSVIDVYKNWDIWQ